MDIHIGNMLVKVPVNYQKVDSAPGDPAGSVPFMTRTEQMLCFVMMMGIPRERAMPFEKKEEVIDGIHQSLGEDQGLIEVESGLTKSERKYIYSIVKTLKIDQNGVNNGVQYCLMMHIDYGDDGVLQVQGFYDEVGMTGLRDALIFSVLQNQGLVSTDGKEIKGWMVDPYDSDFKRGISMNMSEKIEYDEKFPNHPLSQARKMVLSLIELN